MPRTLKLSKCIIDAATQETIQRIFVHLGEELEIQSCLARLVSIPVEYEYESIVYKIPDGAETKIETQQQASSPMSVFHPVSPRLS